MSEPRAAAMLWIGQALQEEFPREDNGQLFAMATLLDARCLEMSLLTEALVVWIHQKAPKNFWKVLGAWYLDSGTMAAEQQRLTGTQQ